MRADIIEDRGKKLKLYSGDNDGSDNLMSFSVILKDW